ncbi:MAG: hypothetical protein ACHQ52_05180 [Candidatus Eisenbacteria bacterium]
MSPPPPSSAEPASPAAGVSPDVETSLTRLADAVVVALGRSPLALILGGSHAVSEAVWVTHEGRRVSLSDLDLWAVLPDERERRVAAVRLETAGPVLSRQARVAGFLAPIEVTLLTPATLEALPARPATLELAARGKVLVGGDSWLMRVPRHEAADVPREEILLLLENRGFELLWAWSAATTGAPLDGWRARHAVLKTALDLAAVLALTQRELPIGAASRVAWARERLVRDPALAPLAGVGLEALWDAAMAWRSGEPATNATGWTDEWRRAVSAWVAVWRHVGDAGLRDPVALAMTMAARASWPRRLRRSIAFRPRLDPPGFAARLAAAPRGTPQHRLGAAAAVMLAAAAETGPEPALGDTAARALRRLAVTPVCAGWGPTAVALTRRWDAWVLDGRRGAGLA